MLPFLVIGSVQIVGGLVTLLSKCAVNPLNATGANMHQVPMLTDNYGTERVKYMRKDIDVHTELEDGKRGHSTN